MEPHPSVALVLTHCVPFTQGGVSTTGQGQRPAAAGTGAAAETAAAAAALSAAAAATAAAPATAGVRGGAGSSTAVLHRPHGPTDATVSHSAASRNVCATLVGDIGESSNTHLVHATGCGGATHFSLLK